MRPNTRPGTFGVVAVTPGHHQAAWRHPDCRAQGHVEIDFFQRIARTAEQAKFDFLFVPDGMGGGEKFPDVFERLRPGQLEPLTLMSALAVSTEKLGLVATISTSANTPYQIARRVASLDHISKGRAGWNLITSRNAVEDVKGEGAGYEHDKRYRRGAEVLAGVHALWDSWTDDAFPRDKASGQFLRLSEGRPADLDGDYYALHGLMNLPRPPQGRPLQVQAGQSDTGRDLAAAHADMIFTVQPSLESGQAFYRDIKARAGRLGRNPDHIRVVPGFSPYVGRSRAEAEDFHEQLQSLIDPVAGLGELSRLAGIDLRGCHLDDPLPEVADKNAFGFGSVGFQDTIQGIASREKLSIRQLLRRIAGARGHLEFVGSALEVADMIEAWLVGEGSDGFNIMPPFFHGGFDRFVTLVVPELQRRGLFRTEYTGRTLREHLGLPRPA